jgi:hypothetical protein
MRWMRSKSSLISRISLKINGIEAKCFRNNARAHHTRLPIAKFLGLCQPPINLLGNGV